MNKHTKQTPFTLPEGEGYKTEFKEKIAGLDREIVAFANATGGSIFLGITDDGQVKGISVSNRLKSQIMDIARNCDPSIKVKIKTITYLKEKIIELIVQEGTDKPYRCKDGFFLRIGPSTQKLRRDEIVHFINHTGKIHFDETMNETFQYPKDFSEQAFLSFLKYCSFKTRIPNKDILINLNVAKESNKKLVFTNAGILFFAHDPQSFLPESYITAVLYESLDRFSIIDKKDFFGSPITQIEETMQFLIRNMRVEAKITSKKRHPLIRREDIYDYPPVALREALVNAVTHRDYFYDGSHIYVHMYPDRIEIENPGGLYHGLTIENLGKRSIRRNRLIADLLHRSHYIERVGSGFDRMKHALEDNNNPPLEVSATNFFNIRFYKRIKEEAISLTERQTKIYSILEERKESTNKQIATSLKISDDTARRELNTLLALGVIKKVGVGKATTYKLKE